MKKMNANNNVMMNFKNGLLKKVLKGLTKLHPKQASDLPAIASDS
jgi:hypothetical protein